MRNVRDPRIGSVELVPTMGTVVSLDVRTPTTPERFGAAAREVADRLREIDRLLSAWQPDSWVSRLIDGRAVLTDCPVEVQHVIGLATEAMDLTAGCFSPYWRHGVRGEADAPGPDPTGLVKGWAAQQASTILVSHGMPDHVVNAAGDLVVSGAADTSDRSGRSWKVGISDTPGSGGLLGVVELDASPTRWAVATSGSAELGHHILDPHEHRPADTVRTATAVARLDEVAEAGAVTDACATALVAAGDAAPALMHRLAARGVSTLVVNADGTVHDPHSLLATSEAPRG